MTLMFVILSLLGLMLASIEIVVAPLGKCGYSELTVVGVEMPFLGW
jgi:hypothetical protein